MPVVRQHHPEHGDRQLGHGRLQGHHPRERPADHQLHLDHRDHAEDGRRGGHPRRWPLDRHRCRRRQGLGRRQPRRRHRHPGRLGRVLPVQGRRARAVHHRWHVGRVDEPDRCGLPGRPFVSPTAYVTSAGRYCWRAVFSGDSANGIPSSSDSSRHRVLHRQPGHADAVDDGRRWTSSSATRSPTRPTLGGTATQPANPVINLTGTAGAAAGGTITFKLYGPSNCTAAGVHSSTPRSAVQSRATAPTTARHPQFVPTPPGNYHWVAVYSGNSPNTNGVTHNAACTDTQRGRRRHHRAPRR